MSSVSIFSMELLNSSGTAFSNHGLIEAAPGQSEQIEIFEKPEKIVLRSGAGEFLGNFTVVVNGTRVTYTCIDCSPAASFRLNWVYITDSNPASHRNGFLTCQTSCIFIEGTIF